MRILICRIGAFGDCIITTPLVRRLKELGHEVYYLVSEGGHNIIKHNPHISKIIVHVTDSIPGNKLGEYFKAVSDAHECDALIDLCESIEVNLALYPADPRYKYPKYERKALCDKNYYEETIAIAGKQLGYCILPTVGGPQDVAPFHRPEWHHTDMEDKAMRTFFTKLGGQFTVVVGLSGSARQKVYPYYKEMIERITKEIPSAQFITVGDEPCQILEYNLAGMDNVMCTAGIWGIRESILACKYADLVISPDTGLLHGSGCFDTPKIALLTSTSHENISKHFENVYPLESKGVGCAPCFYLIYDADTQCNLGENKACLCMDRGIKLDDIVETTLEVFYKFPRKPILEITNV